MNTNKESESAQPLKSPEHCEFVEIWNEHRKNTMNHLLNMASTKGFKAHTWRRVQELENDISGYYKGIQNEFLEKVKGVKNESV